MGQSGDFRREIFVVGDRPCRFGLFLTARKRKTKGNDFVCDVCPAGDLSGGRLGRSFIFQSAAVFGGEFHAAYSARRHQRLSVRSYAFVFGAGGGRFRFQQKMGDGSFRGRFLGGRFTGLRRRAPLAGYFCEFYHRGQRCLGDKKILLSLDLEAGFRQKNLERHAWIFPMTVSGVCVKMENVVINNFPNPYEGHSRGFQSHR